MKSRLPKILIAILVLISLSLTIVLFFNFRQSRARDGEIVQLAADPIYVADTLPDIQISTDEIIASGFSRPVQVTNAGDGLNRMFVVEQTGKVRILQNGVVLPTPFINLESKVACCGERGLLGIAFHPNYSSNGFFYVNYSRASDGATIIERYSVSDSNPNTADPNSGMILLAISQPYGNHNGGQVMFNPIDGYLYIGMGDGGSGGDPQDNAQNFNALLGAMLRIDVDNGSPYGIPPDNPFVKTDGKDEIWAVGLRNPWRFSFDRQNGDLYIGDVGQNQWEEIDFWKNGTSGGQNYGWRCKEGTHDYNFSASCQGKSFIDPVAEYSHSVGHSVTGGFVYRGISYPDLVGRYFYADYVDGKIWSIYKTGTDPETWSSPEFELKVGYNISSFGEDEEGELYVVDYSGGVIRRLTDVNGPTPNLDTSKKQVSPPSADPLDVVTYTIHISNTGGLVNETAFLTDTVPGGLVYVPNSLQASLGIVDDTNSPELTWNGNLSTTRHITVIYQVTVTNTITGSIVNEAQLTIPDGESRLLKAALTTPKSVLETTQKDFIFPGTQPDQLHTSIASSVDCDTCHSDEIYNNWRGSMMSQAARDPVFWAAVYTANIDAPNSGDLCLRCHTLKGWLEGRSEPPDGSALLGEDISNGIACATCHRSVDPIASTMDEASTIDQAIRDNLDNPIPPGFNGSSAIIVDPDDNRRGPFSFDLLLSYHTAFQTDFFRQSGDAVTRARMCGSCHNVYNPVLSWDETRGQYWINDMDTQPSAYEHGKLFPVETTFQEWLYSDFARNGVYAPQFAGDLPNKIVRTCQDCHMPRTTGVAADSAFDPVYRDCETTGCLPEHIFVGGNTWIPEVLQNEDWRLSASGESDYLHTNMLNARAMLRKAASLDLTLTDNGTWKTATVRVTNRSGHKLPTGYPEGRRIWINLKAYDDQGHLIYESGAYDSLTGQLTQDPDIKVYEAKQGITPELAAVLPQDAGATFHFVLGNTVIKDNRIPPQGFVQAEYNQAGMRPVGLDYSNGQNWDETTYQLPASTARIVAILYYQTASKEYIEFLRDFGGIDGLELYGLWEKSKSPPQIMTIAYAPEVRISLPFVSKNAP